MSESQRMGPRDRQSREGVALIRPVHLMRVPEESPTLMMHQLLQQYRSSAVVLASYFLAVGAHPTTRISLEARPRALSQTSATTYRTYQGSGFQLDVPTEWRDVPGTHGVAFAPESGFRAGILSHGIDVGLVGAASENLEAATRAFVAFLGLANPRLRETTPARRGTMSGRLAVATTFANASQITGEPEIVKITAAFAHRGLLFYLVMIVPTAEEMQYNATFEHILRSVRMSE